MAALTDFEKAIDAMRLSDADKAAVKALGFTLLREGEQEWAEHLDFHLDAQANERPGDAEFAARVTALKEATQRIRAGEAGVAAFLDGRGDDDEERGRRRG